ncbi:MAG: DNA polymerase III subunit epsilon [Bacteroidetes bacterium]|nr:DNA polymerase III subunit epsilon [Bacteroidota bacterium]
MFCIIDIETTGGSAARHRIIEIGGCLHDGERVVERFHSYVNPGVAIPSFITQLTGIDDDTVANAPTFAQLAHEFYQFMAGHVFVAHNVGFDYGFIKNHLAEEGISVQSQRLCTVRLARKVLPGLASYSLGRLCQSLHIPVEGRHTALGDVEATSKLFSLLKSLDNKGIIAQMTKRNSKEWTLPPHIDRQILDSLPASQGVYLMLDQQARPIYIGKSKNIRSRVESHFGTGSESRLKGALIEQVRSIHTIPCGNDLITDLTELHEIKKHWPRYNREYKKRAVVYGIYHYTDARGYIRYHVHKVLLRSKPLLVFTDYTSAYQYLKELGNRFQLCPKLIGLQLHGHHCIQQREGLCQDICPCGKPAEDYSQRTQASLRHIEQGKMTYMIVGQGLQPSTYGVVLVEKGRYLGYGYTEKQPEMADFEQLKLGIALHKPSMEVEQILQVHLARGGPYLRVLMA